LLLWSQEEVDVDLIIMSYCYYSTFSFRLLALVLYSCITKSAVALMNVSPVERIVLESRLEGIKSAIQQKYNKQELLSVIPPQQGEEQSIETFIFPGAGGVDELIVALDDSIEENSVVVDWAEYRGSILTSAYESEAVGEAIAEGILTTRELKPQDCLHFIGVSVGAFAANAAATIITQNDNMKCRVRLTLLDPFCGRGVFQPNYGKKHFGKYATTAIHILNTDDPVPTTNDPLPHCYCLDVTKAPEREEFVPPPGDSMHSWPLAYFIWQDCQVGNDPDKNYPRGVVVNVNEWSTEAMPPLPW
jgi:hypothetical protein